MSNSEASPRRLELVVGKKTRLVHRHRRRGDRRRQKLQLAFRLLLSVAVVGVAAALSAGVVHLVERPVPPWKLLADRLPAQVEASGGADETGQLEPAAVPTPHE